MSNCPPYDTFKPAPAASRTRVQSLGDSSLLFKNGLLCQYACEVGGQRYIASCQQTFSAQDDPAVSLRAELLQSASVSEREALAAICTASRLDRSILLDCPLPGPDLHADTLGKHLSALVGACSEALEGLPLVLRHLHPRLHPALSEQLTAQGWQWVHAGHLHVAKARELADSHNLYLRHDLTLANDDCQLLNEQQLLAEDYPRLHWLTSQSSLVSMRQYQAGFVAACFDDPSCRIHALKLGRKLVAVMITRQVADMISLLALAVDPALSPAYAAERRLLARMYLDGLKSASTLLYPLELANYCRLRGIDMLPMQHAFLLNHLPARQRLAAAGLLDYLRQQSAPQTARPASK